MPKFIRETHESKVLYNRALEHISRSRTREAMRNLEEALQIAPRNAAYLSQYALCVAIEEEDFDAAKKLCERAIRIDGRDPLHRVNLGRIYRLEGRNGDAYREFLQAWEEDRFHPAPATELTRMGIRRPPVLPFLSRSHWLNVRLGRLRAHVVRTLSGAV